LRRGGDIKEDHLIRPLIVVADGQGDRIPHVPEASFFSSSELNTTRYLAIVDVETGNYSPGKHGKNL
jgi:hypothetical protein